MKQKFDLDKILREAEAMTPADIARAEKKAEDRFQSEKAERELWLGKFLKKASQDSRERVQTELAEKNLKLGQILRLGVDKMSDLRMLNGAEIRVTSINKETGVIEFRLTDNNDPAVLEHAKGLKTEINLRSLREPPNVAL